MGLGYTIDTPVKVAKFGITSVVSIMEDHLIEQMREFYCKRFNQAYQLVPANDPDRRVKRISSYLNLLYQRIVSDFAKMKREKFVPGTDLYKYFLLLPAGSPLRRKFELMINMPEGKGKMIAQDELLSTMPCGRFEVNIMTKLDNRAYDAEGNLLPEHYSDAKTALRGFAISNVEGAVVFSAGLNPKLFSACLEFPDFFPDQNGKIKKQIILKVSDYRSALIQGKFLAAKGLWVSEFRIESGLNCGGHAFPTDGILFGPILDEFKCKRQELQKELADIVRQTWKDKFPGNEHLLTDIRITAQGGIGTFQEDAMLREFYKLDGTGWGSPFLLVPEATNVDEQTLLSLCEAKPEDYFLSNASPLGVPFNNFRKSSSEQQRNERINKGKPGSPCYKKFLTFNKEFTEKPICLASRQYLDLKFKDLNGKNLSAKAKQRHEALILERDCLCEGLGSAALIKNKLKPSHGLTAVTICPGPNLAYFSKVLSLQEMVDHIYGRAIYTNSIKRPHLFIKELEMYLEYLTKQILDWELGLIDKKKDYFQIFIGNLQEGIDYYFNFRPELNSFNHELTEEFSIQLEKCSNQLKQISENVSGMNFNLVTA